MIYNKKQKFSSVVVLFITLLVSIAVYSGNSLFNNNFEKTFIEALSVLNCTLFFLSSLLFYLWQKIPYTKYSTIESKKLIMDRVLSFDKMETWHIVLGLIVNLFVSFVLLDTLNHKILGFFYVISFTFYMISSYQVSKMQDFFISLGFAKKEAHK